jgi:hypothetical protein
VGNSRDCGGRAVPGLMVLVEEDVFRVTEDWNAPSNSLYATFHLDK